MTSVPPSSWVTRLLKPSGICAADVALMLRVVEAQVAEAEGTTTSGNRAHPLVQVPVEALPVGATPKAGACAGARAIGPLTLALDEERTTAPGLRCPTTTTA